jgi:hypothetical protein
MNFLLARKPPQARRGIQVIEGRTGCAGRVHDLMLDRRLRAAYAPLGQFRRRSYPIG